MIDTPEIFWPHRPNLIKFYELLKAAESPLPRTRILQAANLGQNINNPLFYWLLKQKLIEQIDYKDIGKITCPGIGMEDVMLRVGS